MKLRRLFHVKKSRIYPIKRDEEGLSLRARCFEFFEQGKRPVAVVEELKMTLPTVCRYFRDWRRLGQNFERKYDYVRSLFKKTVPDRDKNIELFARVWRIPKEQLETILSRPHGLRRLMTGKYYFPAHADVDHKGYIVLELALLISDHLTKRGGKFVDVDLALKRYMQENMKCREDEDTDIEEDNKMMAFFHQVLAADMENERKGRVKPDTFTAEEKAALIRYGEEYQIKRTETSYWFVVGILKANGLTVEQACEKIYEYLVNKGDLEYAKMARKFQEKFHRLEKNDQIPPQPPPPT